MARRFERHARAKSDWGSPPGRSAELATVVAGQHPEPVTGRRAPARKDTRSWCKGKEGIAHVPKLSEHRAHPRDRGCEWRPGWILEGDDEWPVEWKCAHRELCARCGKVLREPWQIPDAECPAYPGTPQQRAEADAEAVKHAEHRRAWEERRASRKPPVTGPQGYRRKRAS